MIELPTLWPHQVRGLAAILELIDSGVLRILLTSPTGGGKTRLVQELVSQCLEWGWPATIYTNRNLLREQTSRVLTDWGFSHGVRAAGHESNLEELIQIVSVQSESNRVFGTKKKSPVWGHHKSRLVITDEIHLNQGEQLRKLKERHNADGAIFLDVTATPLDLVESYDAMVQAGTVSELRDCGSLLFARHRAINEPDVRKVRPNAAGEYEIEPGKFRTIWMHAVVSSVIGNYRQFNPDRRPTILFAPGVKESIWFAEQFTQAGIRWAHIDGGNVWLDGEMHRGQEMRDEVIKELRQGKIAGVSNRFVLREGIDIPELFMGILATVFGDLKSYLQSVGRILRYHPSLPGYVAINDHGGNWWRHGSPNIDRIWELGQRARIVNAQREDAIREGKEKQPLVCPFCKTVRDSGPICHACGRMIEATKSRQVIQHDGDLREVTGPVMPPRVIRDDPDVQKIWQNYYYRAKKSKNNMTFRQARGLMFSEQGFWSSENLRLMPKEPGDWFRPVKEVPISSLL